MVTKLQIQHQVVTNLQIHSELKRRFARVTSNYGKKINIEEWDAYFNEAYRAWYKDRVSVAKTNNKVRYDLRKLFIPNKKIEIGKSGRDHVIANMPDDYYDIHRVSVRAISDKCKTPVYLTVAIVQGNDWESTFMDPEQRPSFLWRRTLADECSDGLRIGVIDFKVEAAWLDYYKKPTSIYSPELGDCYVDIRSVVGSSNIAFELEEFQMDEVVDVAVYFACRDNGMANEAKTQFEKIIFNKK